MAPTLHTQWADAVLRGDKQGALNVSLNHGLIPDERLTNFFLADLARSKDARRNGKEADFGVRFDSADPVVGVTGWGIAENYFILSKTVTLLPFVGTPLMDNLPVVGPEEYPPMADRYIAQIAQTGLGDDQEMSGVDVDFPVFESTTTPLEFNTELRGGKVVVTWAQQQRGALPGAVNLDKAATDLKGLQKRLGELRPERSAHEGNPDRGVYGLVNHPNIEIVTPSQLTYGTNNMQSWGTTEAAIRDIANTIVGYLQVEANRAIGIEGYTPDSVIWPNWLEVMSGRLVYGEAAGGSTYPVKPMKQYVQEQCPWVKKFIPDSWLNAVNNTTNRLAISSNGVPDSSVLSSRLFCLKLDKEAIHFAQPIAYQQLPPWMSGPARFETAAYHQNGGVVVKLETPGSSMIC